MWKTGYSGFERQLQIIIWESPIDARFHIFISFDLRHGASQSFRNSTEDMEQRAELSCSLDLPRLYVK